MRKSRFTEAQIIGMIKEQEAGIATAEVCRRHGLSPATFYELLRTFLTVVEVGSLSRACEKLNVSQSTVTARIDTLEAELGQRLLLRNKGGTELTATGHKFLRHARSMLSLWHHAQRDIALPRGYSDVCALACNTILWEGAGEVLVALIREAEPTIAVEITCGSDAETAARLASGTADLGLLYDSPAGDALVSKPVFDDWFLQFSTVRRGLQRWDTSYVYVHLGDRFRLAHAEAYPVEESATVSFNNPAHALAHIRREGGSAYLPQRLVQSSGLAAQIHEVTGAARLKRQVWLAMQRERLSVWPWLKPLRAALAGECKFEGDPLTA